MITYSAPGKIILSGEHAVVYGKPALVSAINLRLKFSVFKAKEKTEDKVINFISKEVIKYLKLNKITYEEKNFDYKIESQIPIGRGMGSSAALSTAGAACFLEFYTGRIFSTKEINNIGFNIERYFHAHSSGVDVAVTCFGGLIYYRKEFDFLRNIFSLDFILPAQIENHLFLIDTGKPSETTGDMVMRVRKLYKKNKRLMTGFLNKCEETTKNIVLSIKENNTDILTQSIAENEKLLEAVGVVSAKAKKILKELKTIGVGKITGGGGKKTTSGFIIFYNENFSYLKKYCQQNNLNLYSFKQSKKGLKKENI